MTMIDINNDELLQNIREHKKKEKKTNWLSLVTGSAQEPN
jgi:hypothetical protein